MQTEVLQKIDLQRAIDSLKRGEPVVFPTETVYGLGAPIFNEECVRKIFSIKGRPADNPLIVHIASIEEAKKLAEAIPSSFYKLAEAFWPGPLTMVLPKRPNISSLISAGNPTIAIRMPKHPIAKALLLQMKEPIAAPSANLSGRPSPTSVRDVLEDLEGKVRYIIDGGECEVGIESTVISLVHEVPTLLRPGHITQEMLEQVLGQKVDLPKKNEPVLSPGMKYRHYAPKAKVRLIFRKEEGSFVIPTAQTLYQELRNADRANLSEVVIYCDERVQKDAALMNRLLRASEK